MGYYLCFALALVPAGHYAQKVGQRPLMACGLGLIAIGLITLLLPLGVAGRLSTVGASSKVNVAV